MYNICSGKSGEIRHKFEKDPFSLNVQRTQMFM